MSNNKIHFVPFQLWRAPKLKDLNMSFNLIKQLPYAQSEDEARSLREKSVGRIPILDKVYEVKKININDDDEYVKKKNNFEYSSIFFKCNFIFIILETYH